MTKRNLLILFVLFLAVGPVRSRAASTGWTLVGWNDLGMHCMDGDYSVYAILPPYNTIHAQLMDSSGKLVKSGAGITITYSAIRDGSGSINVSSSWKTNFWSFVQKLFGLSLVPGTGMTGNQMPDANNQPRSMKFDGSYNWFTADAIPITPYDDAGNKNYYPMMRLTATDSSGAVLATTNIVLPVSDEMSCRTCHASGMDETKPSSGWAWNRYAERDYKINILRLHDDRQSASQVFKNALQAAGYSTSGLAATSASGTPVLCASCHASNALGTKGHPGVPQLTQSIHAWHAHVMDDATGMPLDSLTDRGACYSCHPGSATRCLRGVMGNSVAADGTMAIQCQNCHGTMSVVGASGRNGWFDEPNCQTCHSGTAVRNSGQVRFTSALDSSGHLRQPADTRFATTSNAPSAGVSLYRFSTGHGGLQCEACHGSTHAEWPSSHANDNVQAIALQGKPGPIAECSVCHHTLPANLANGGPHALHWIGPEWVQRHGNATENGGQASCQDCHGADYKGSVLSQARNDRQFNAFGSRQLWRGYQVSCYTCHNGASNHDSATKSVPPAVSDGTASTSVGTAVSIQLSTTGTRDGTRIVSQPSNGTVSLSGTSAVFTPFVGFEGSDAFTFAVSNSGIDSNLGTIRLTVTASGRPTFPANGVVSAASYQGGAVSPGEMVTIFGAGLGSADICNFEINSAGLIGRTLCDTRVLFGGLPAPLIYSSAQQISAMVPYGVAGSATTPVQVEYQGILSNPVSVPVTASLPAIFSVDMTGKGPGAILNQDGITLNSASQPAPRGSVVSLFATGEGLMDATFIDGQLAIGILGKPVLKVTVQIGGMDADVQYAGSAPGNVAGFIQVNAKVPDNAPTGAAVPVLLKIGDAVSQSGPTLAIR